MRPKIGVTAVVTTAVLAGAAQAQGANLEAIRHSANWAETALKGETTPAKETVDIPKDGPFIRASNGTNLTEIVKFADEHGVDFPFIFTNPAPKKGKGEGFCVLAGATNLNEGNSVAFKRNGTNGMLYVPANSSVMM
jgi:hypothetical protein